MSISQLDPSVDGRRLRGQLTQIKVLEALLELVAEGEMRPTAQAVSSRAGVSLRTVYHHFQDVEDVRRRALDLQRSRAYAAFRPIDTSLPVDQRVTALCRQIRQLFEAISPIRRSMMADDPGRAELRESGRRGRGARQAKLIETFPELKAKTPAMKVLFAAVDTATSWSAWNYQRAGVGRSVAASETVMADTVIALLAGLKTGRERRSK
jgi:AcrR family transcriptional regulator